MGLGRRDSGNKSDVPLSVPAFHLKRVKRGTGTCEEIRFCSLLGVASAAGTVNLTASVGSVTTQIQVNVLSGTSLPIGTVLWTAPSTAGSTVEQIAQAVPTPNGPDLYSIESGSSGGNPSTLVRALSSDGQTLWQNQLAALYNNKAVPDGNGGLLLNLYYPVSSGAGTASIVDLDAQTGSQVWRYDYDSAANARIIAVGPDGTAYLTETSAATGARPTFENFTYYSNRLAGGALHRNSQN